MDSEVTSQAQENVECNLCQAPVSSFCRRCRINLCEACIPEHLRVKKGLSHDVVKFINKDDDETCFCDSHPQQECSAFCETCNLPICSLCACAKQKSHKISKLRDKIEEILKDIAMENDRLQSYRFRHQLGKVLEHTIEKITSLSSVCQRGKDEVTAQGEKWHRLIDNYVKKLHQEFDDTEKEIEAVLQKQKRKSEQVFIKIDEINTELKRIQKSKNVGEMQKFKLEIKEQTTIQEITEYLFPTYHECTINENNMPAYFGYIEKKSEKTLSHFRKNFISGSVSVRKVFEMPFVIFVIDTEFPPHENSNRLYDVALSKDNQAWFGGQSEELKSFDLNGTLNRNVKIKCRGFNICTFNQQVIYSDTTELKTISDDNTIVTMFTTGKWEPQGITCAAPGDLLVCLMRDDQSKVVRYSRTGSALQEIQYDSKRQPLYQAAWYIAENVNGDIIVTDYWKEEVITVDKLGIFRYSYSETESPFKPAGVATDSVGHIFVADLEGNKIQLLDSDGRFLSYIIPYGGIKDPIAICLLEDGEIIVGECKTSLVKVIKFM